MLSLQCRPEFATSLLHDTKHSEVMYVETGLQQAPLQVSVMAVGLNFRDVLNILGMYPGDPGDPGGDCAGIVSAIGPGIRNAQDTLHM